MISSWSKSIIVVNIKALTDWWKLSTTEALVFVENKLHTCSLLYEIYHNV